MRATLLLLALAACADPPPATFVATFAPRAAGEVVQYEGAPVTRIEETFATYELALAATYALQVTAADASTFAVVLHPGYCRSYGLGEIESETVTFDGVSASPTWLTLQWTTVACVGSDGMFGLVND